MIRTSGIRIWVATAPVDMRRGFDRLAEQVRTVLGEDPLSGHLFVFRSRTGERAKILWWDKNGFVLYYKRLERGTFQFPSPPTATGKSGGAVAIESRQLMELLAGLQVDAGRGGRGEQAEQAERGRGGEG